MIWFLPREKGLGLREGHPRCRRRFSATFRRELGLHLVRATFGWGVKPVGLLAACVSNPQASVPLCE